MQKLLKRYGACFSFVLPWSRVQGEDMSVEEPLTRQAMQIMFRDEFETGNVGSDLSSGEHRAYSGTQNLRDAPYY
ncbi:MAG: hypothetical protein ACPGVK_00230 [Halocynthiibacter sp.]